MSIIFSTGQPNLYLNGEEASENMRKWTVDDVYNFINNIPTCCEYAQVGCCRFVFEYLVFFRYKSLFILLK